MPKDQAMDFVLAEYNRGLAKERPPRDPADIAAEASQLLDDYLDREKIARHTVPSETRQLFVLLAEGVHLYPEELETISEYVRSRQDHVQGETLHSAVSALLCPWVVYLCFTCVLSPQLPTVRVRKGSCYLQGWGNHLLCFRLHLGHHSLSLHL